MDSISERSRLLPTLVSQVRNLKMLGEDHIEYTEGSSEHDKGISDGTTTELCQR